MKTGILCMLYILSILNLFAQGQERNDIIGIGVGMSPEYDNAIWIGDPVNIWATKKTSPVFQIFYARQVRDAIRLGGYFEI